MSSQSNVQSETDVKLLQAFLHEGNELAFAELVRRHGPLVFSVCGRVLRRDDDVDDAFQMTFLVLARDAKKIRKRQSLVSWLHGVAHRSALSVWRKQYGRPVVTLSEQEMINNHHSNEELFADVAARDQQRLLDEELMQLSEIYRDPLIRHYLQGESRQEIARTLGVSVATIKGRLQRGRDSLRTRLSFRGVSLIVVVAALRAAQSTENSARLDALVDGTLERFANLDHRSLLGNTNYWSGGFSMHATISLATLALVSCGILMMIGHTANRSAAAQTIEISPTFPQDREQHVRIAQKVSEEDGASGNQPKVATSVRYGDGKADGKKSLGGSAHMIQFKLPSDRQAVTGMRLHAARYGHPQPPDEEVEIHFVEKDGGEIINTEFVKYGKFKRGESRWVTIKFKKPLELPAEFWVIVDFDPGRTKGVYLSYDTNSEGKYSRIGLPGAKSKTVDFGGDWMVQLMLSKPKSDDGS